MHVNVMKRHHADERGGRVILHLGNRWSCWPSAALCQGERYPRYPADTCRRVPQSRSGQWKEENKLLPMPVTTNYRLPDSPSLYVCFPNRTSRTALAKRMRGRSLGTFHQNDALSPPPPDHNAMCSLREATITRHVCQNVAVRDSP
jgi:hypothetical protein